MRLLAQALDQNSQFPSHEFPAQLIADLFLHGEKLSGGFFLVRTGWGGKKKNWLLIKEKDEAARPGTDVTSDLPLSVASGRDVDDLS